MIVNGKSLLEAHPIKGMLDTKVKGRETTHGLGEAGYDIRIKQTIIFKPGGWSHTDTTPCVSSKWTQEDDQKVGEWRQGRFTLASAIEEFDMPDDLVGIVHDKSTWARRGLSVFNTVIEPGWKGFLTLELVYHGQENLVIPAGSGIAQVIFHRTQERIAYSGRYQNQENRPVEAKLANGTS